MKKLRILFLLFLMLNVLFVFFKKVDNNSVLVDNITYLDDNDNQVIAEDARNAVIETANAYYRKGANIQYDGYRHAFYFSPEKATSQNILYTVCSGFTYQVYYQTLGIELPETTNNLETYARKINYSDNANNLIYYKGVEYTDTNGTMKRDKQVITEISQMLSDDNQRGEFINYLKDTLLPGDIIVIRRAKIKDTSVDEENEDNDTAENGDSTDASSDIDYDFDYTGHAMLFDYIDEDGKIKILNSTGTSYDMTKHIEKMDTLSSGEGSVRLIDDFEQYLIKQNTNSSTKLQSIAIIRIITDDMQYPDKDDVSKMIKIKDITSSSKTRNKYPSLEINKLYTINGEQTSNKVVSLGDEIEYTITVENRSNTTYDNLNISENIGNYVDYVDQEISNNVSFNSNNGYSWTISGLNAGEIATIKYRVRVKNDVENIGKLIKSDGKVENIDNATVVNEIGINLTSDEKERFLNVYKDLRDNSTNSGYKFYAEVYKEAGFNNLEEELNKLYKSDSVIYNPNELVTISQQKCDKINIWTNRYCDYVISDKIKGMILNNFYGVRVDSAGSGVNYVDKLISPYYAWNWFLNDEEEYFYERALTTSLDNLDVGDIIIYYTDSLSSKYVAYMYLGNNVLFRKINAQGYVENYETGPIYYNYTSSGTATSNYIIRNIVGESYVILRPSLLNYKEVEDLSLSDDDISVNINDNKFVTVSITPIDSTNQKVTWLSSNPEIATVEDGKITGISTGTSVISAVIKKKDGSEIVKTTNVTVNDPTPKKIPLNTNNVEIDEGSSFEMVVVETPDSGSFDNLIWSSSNEEVATVDDNGLITAIKPGNTIITVKTSDGSYESSCNVVVNDSKVAVESVSLDLSNYSLKVGKKFSLTATINPTNATNQNVSWSSTDNSIVSVDSNGNVTAISVGSASIIVTTEDGSKTANCVVSVTKEEVDTIDVEIVNTNASSAEVKIGSETQLIATVLPENATNKEIVWSSSNDSVASVDNTGLVKFLRGGSVIITATVKDTNISSNVTFNVVSSEKDISAVCEPYVTYSNTESDTLYPVVAVLNFKNDNCQYVNTATKTFDSNGEYTFVYVDDNNRKGSIIAKVDWIGSEIVLNPDTGLNVKTILLISILSITVVIFVRKKKI